MRKTLDAYFSAVNEDRFDDVAALFAPDATLTAPGVGPLEARRDRGLPGQGAERLPEPPRRTDAHAARRAAATVEITFTGETTDGTPITFDALDVFDFDEHGRITRLRTWFDSHELRKKLRA